jgi:hypothetical protein
MISGVLVSPNESSTYPPTRVREVQSPLIWYRQELSGLIQSPLIHFKALLLSSYLCKQVLSCINHLTCVNLVIPTVVSGRPLDIQRRIGVREHPN